MTNKNDIKAVIGCSILLAEIMICTAIGGFFTWPVGTSIFGVLLLSHVLWTKIRMKRRGEW